MIFSQFGWPHLSWLFCTAISRVKNLCRHHWKRDCYQLGLNMIKIGPLVGLLFVSQRCVLFRPPGLADNAGTGRTSIWTHAEDNCAISNTSLLLARETRPDKKNFALEHCQPAPPVGNPLEWKMNDRLPWNNWALSMRDWSLRETFN